MPAAFKNKLVSLLVRGEWQANKLSNGILSGRSKRGSWCFEYLAFRIVWWIVSPLSRTTSAAVVSTPKQRPVGCPPIARAVVQVIVWILTDQSNGSATLMRGKSATCRGAHFFLW